MAIKIKVRESLSPMPVEKKDLVYVPKFINESGLNDLVWDIHAQYKNAANGEEESGWEGDARAFSFRSAMKATEFKYLIAIGNSDTIFAFTSKLDRDCVLSDYLPDSDVW